MSPWRRRTVGQIISAAMAGLVAAVSIAPAALAEQWAGASVDLLAAGSPDAVATLSDLGFSDVSDDHRFAEAIQWLVHHGITTGTTEGRFEPARPVTRGQMAAFLWRYAGSPEGAPAVEFVDVAPDAWNATAVAFLADARITEGIDARRFGGGGPLTRAQMASFLWRLERLPEAEAPSTFADVPAGHVHAPAIVWLTSSGITTGVDADRFAPAAPVTRGQMAAFLWRLAGRPHLHEPPPPFEDAGAQAPGRVVAALCDLRPLVEELIGRPLEVDRGAEDYALELDYSLRHACAFSSAGGEVLYLSRWPDARDDPADVAGSIAVDAGDRAWVSRRDGRASFLTVQRDGHTLYLRAPIEVVDVARDADRSTFADWASALSGRSLPFDS